MTLEQAIQKIRETENDYRNTSMGNLLRADALKLAVDILEGKLIQELTDGSLQEKVAKINELEDVISEKDSIIAEKENQISEKEALIVEKQKIIEENTVEK